MAADLLGAMRVEIVGDNKKLDKSIDDSEKKTKDFGKTAAKLGDTLSKLFAGIGFALVAKKIFDVAKASSELAAQAEEIRSKFNVVFGESAAVIEDWATTYSASVGRSTTDTLGFLGSRGDLLKPLGFSKDAVDSMSKEVVKLANDLGSFNDMPTADVMRDIEAALTGSFEVTKKYGVVLNETVIKQEALNRGLFDGKGVVDAQVKAQIALELIMKGTADAQGDLLRTQDSHTNTMIRLESATKDLGIQLGRSVNEGLTPFASGLATITNTMAIWLTEQNDLADAIKQFAAGTATTEDSMKALNSQLEDEQELLKILQDSLVTSSATFTESINEQIKAQQEVIDSINEEISTKKILFAQEQRSIGQNKQGAEIQAKIAADRKASDEAFLELAARKEERRLAELSDTKKQIEELTKEINTQAKLRDALEEQGKVSTGVQLLINDLWAERAKLQEEEKNKTEENTEAVEDFFDTYSEESRLWLAERNARTEAEKFLLDEEVKANEEAEEKKREARQETIDTALSQLNSFFGALNELSSATAQNQIDNINRTLETRLSAIDAETEATLISLGIQEETRTEALEKRLEEAIAEGDEETAALLQNEIDRIAIIEDAEKRKTAAEEAAAEESKQIQYEAALANWEMQGLQLLANTAAAIMQTIAQWGLPWGLIPAAGVGIIAGVQRQALDAAKPQRFQSGGIVAGEQFGQDSVPAMLSPNEVVMNPRQQAEILMSLANGGGRNGSGRGDVNTINISAMFSLGNDAKLNEAAERLFPALQKVGRRRGATIGGIG